MKKSKLRVIALCLMMAFVLCAVVPVTALASPDPQSASGPEKSAPAPAPDIPWWIWIIILSGVF